MAVAQTIIVCELCDNDNGVKWYCVNCAEKLCGNCKNIHLRSKKTSGDKIILLSEASKQDHYGKAQDFCDKHENKTCEMYCYDCKALICGMCLSEEHKQHQWETVDTAASKARDRYKKLLMNIRELTVQTRFSYKERYDRYIRNTNMLEGKINEQYVQLKKALDSVRDIYISEVEKLRDLAKKDFTATSSKYDTDVVNLEQTMNASVQKLERENSVTLLNHIDEIFQNANRIQLPEMNDQLAHLPLFVNKPMSDSHQSLESMYGNLLFDVQLFYNKLQATPEPFVRSLHSLDENTAWVLFDGDTKIAQVETPTKIQTIYDSEIEIEHFVVDDNGAIFLTFRYFTDSAYKLAVVKQNSEIRYVADNSPLRFDGLCLKEKHILACLKSEEEEGKIVEMTKSGKMITAFEKKDDGSLLFYKPGRITCLPNGNIIVCDQKSNDARVTAIDKKGRHLYTWKGENLKLSAKLWPCDVTNDSKGRVFVSDCKNEQIYLIEGNNGDTLRICCMLEERTSIKEPIGLALETDGVLLIGSLFGKIYKYQY